MLFDASKRQVELDAEVGRGGEGTVYAVRGRQGLLAKVYTELPGPERIAKLAAMAERFAIQPAVGTFCAWPQALIFDETGVCCGFLMARIEDHVPVHDIYQPEQRKSILPHVGWDFLVRTAANCARMFASLHSFGVTVGDVNERNLLVGRDATVHLVDCDSFQIQAGRLVYRTGVGVVDYTPPELQGADFRSAIHTHNHDRFGLAVLLFKLLFMGRHPFSGGATGDISTAIRGHDYDYAGLSARLHHLVPLQAVSREVAELFATAFSAEADNDARPTPEMWLLTLAAFEAGLVICAVDPLHRILRGSARCLWCQIEATLHYAYFARAVGEAYVSHWSHRDEHLDQLQHAMAQVEPPPEPDWYEPQAAVATALTAIAAARRIPTPADPVTWWLRTGSGLVAVAGAAAWANGGLFAQWFVGLGLFSWGGGVARQRMRERPLLLWRAQLAAAAERLGRSEAEWRGEAYRYRQQDRRLRAHFESMRARHEGLGPQRTVEIDRLSSDAVLPELRPFLLRFSLDEATIPGVPQERKRSLQIRGLLTAAELDRAHLLGIPGLSGQAVEALVRWRQTLEIQGGGQRRPPPTHAQLAAIDVNYTHIQENLEAEMAAVIEETATAAERAREALEVLYGQNEKLARDARALAARVPAGLVV